uniref:Uncharacterized protein n=1 Tax=Hucho hucho TaxID=62062 RepID=A0A4W5K8S0_9TELE
AHSNTHCQVDVCLWLVIHYLHYLTSIVLCAGLSHIIETRKILDLKIDLKPSYLLVPKSGFYHAKSDLMIIDFGSLQLVSVDQGNPQSLSPSFSSLEEIMDRAYEKYSLELRSVQVLYSKSGTHTHQGFR